jgi:hypothetical protein
LKDEIKKNQLKKDMKKPLESTNQTRNLIHEVEITR